MDLFVGVRGGVVISCIHFIFFGELRHRSLMIDDTNSNVQFSFSRSPSGIELLRTRLTQGINKGGRKTRIVRLVIVIRSFNQEQRRV